MTEIRTQKINEEYSLQITPIKKGKGYWNHLKVEIFKDSIRIGEYTRNYGVFYQTFCPFRYKDQEYALYSRDYTATRVMKLPECEDLCGEDRNSYGFCPVEYYVPNNKNCNGSFGFVAGCVWGDDSSWKIQYLDLSKLPNEISRDDRFGYIELPSRLYLKDVISVYFDSIEIAVAGQFSFNGEALNKETDEEDLEELLTAAKENKLIDNPFSSDPQTSWIYNVVKKVFKLSDG